MLESKKSKNSKDSNVYVKALLFILIISFFLRVSLIRSGGQYFWPDENRYQTAYMAANHIWHNNDVKSALHLLHSADHFLFKVIAVIPATFQIAMIKYSKSNSNNPNPNPNSTPNSKIPALFFALFSLGNLLVLWGIVQRLGGSRRLCFMSTLFLSLSTTFLYYSRHLLPYDMAMFFGLSSVFFAITKRDINIINQNYNSIFCGLLASCAFLTYNGYWILALLSLLIHFMLTYRSGLRNALLAGISFILPIIILLIVSLLFVTNNTNNTNNTDLLHQFLAFSHTVTQGSFSEGLTLPFYYLWHAEHLILIFWGVAFIYGLITIVILGERSQVMIISVSSVIFIYLIMLLFSNFLQKFVVYGRIARQLVPFLSIIAAIFFERLWTSPLKGKKIASVIMLILLIQAGINFRVPLTQVFPDRFIQLATLLSLPSSEILYAYLIYPEPTVISDEGRRVILKKSHPLQFLPYQYEGFTPEQRLKLRSVDISMRLLQKI
ncbi:MAG: hypothetical protein HQK49_20995 [Oligoflexia bacterium]|nr:hypothetical protein [Oligoflexia bacterium]